MPGKDESDMELSPTGDNRHMMNAVLAGAGILLKLNALGRKGQAIPVDSERTSTTDLIVG